MSSEIHFKNGSTIKTIDATDMKRSKGIFIYDYYTKLRWYQKLWARITYKYDCIIDYYTDPYKVMYRCLKKYYKKSR